MVRTFKKGGIHLKDEKNTESSPIEILPVPEIVYIPLSQHLGSPARSIVTINERVRTGQLIGVADGFISSNVHSSVTGIITAIIEMPDVNKIQKMTVVIKSEPDEWVETIDRNLDHKCEILFSREDIIKKIFDAGIVGMGGATFPSHVKISVPMGKRVDTLIVNGNECEPYLTSDYRLMLEHSEEIITGVKILMLALDISTAYIGIENNKPQAINLFKKLLVHDLKIKVIELKAKYPQGNERLLIKTLLNKEIPSGKLPLDIGVVVQNVATVYSIYQAVQKSMPLIERVVTITGKPLQTPSNYKVRIGTPVNEIINKAGGISTDTGKIILGGPMMGKSVFSSDLPVTKGVSGIILFSKKDSAKKAEYACIRCGSCLKVCPTGLEPYLLNKYVINGKYEFCENESVLDCIECGCCSYICPSGIQLTDRIREAKKKVYSIINDSRK